MGEAGDLLVHAPNKLHKPLSLIQTEVATNKPQFPEIALLKTCLEQGGIRNNPSEIGPTLLFDYQSIPEPPSTTQNTREKKPEITVPDNFDWSKEARISVGKAFKILYKQGVIDKKLLHTTIKLAGPENAVVVPNQHSSHFNLDGYYTYLESKGRTDGILPIPESKEIRNKYIHIEFGEENVKARAARFLMFAKERGIAMTEAQALQAALINLGSHEVAHAVDEAITAGGSEPTYSKTQKLTDVTWAATARKQVQPVHMEHFAIGIENAATDQALQDEFGWTPDQVAQLQASRKTRRSSVDTALGDLFALATEKGLTPGDILFADYAIQKHFSELRREAMPDVSKFDQLVSYSSTPYSQVEIQQFIPSSNMSMPSS